MLTSFWLHAIPMNEILLKEIDIMVNNRKKDNEKTDGLHVYFDGASKQPSQTCQPPVQSVKEPICPIKYLRLQHKHT